MPPSLLAPAVLAVVLAVYLLWTEWGIHGD